MPDVQLQRESASCITVRWISSWVWEGDNVDVTTEELTLVTTTTCSPSAAGGSAQSSLCYHKTCSRQQREARFSLHTVLLGMASQRTRILVYCIDCLPGSLNKSTNSVEDLPNMVEQPPGALLVRQPSTIRLLVHRNCF
jgi:hypothetical protein